jgi:hypothetical protein
MSAFKFKFNFSHGAHRLDDFEVESDDAVYSTVLSHGIGAKKRGGARAGAQQPACQCLRLGGSLASSRLRQAISRRPGPCGPASPSGAGPGGSALA